MSNAARLRGMLAEGQQVLAPGVFDGITARTIAGLGFQAAYLGGFATSVVKGTMEPLLTMSEQTELARGIAEQLDELPLIVDGHTAYGNAVHIVRAIQEFERAGVAAIHIEDQVYPKRVGYHRGIKTTVSKEEMVERVKIACEARCGDMLIVARTDARSRVDGGLDEVVDRLGAYYEAGADGLFPLVYDVEEAKQVHEAIPGAPLLWAGDPNHGRANSMDALRAAGCQIVIFGVLGIVRAFQAYRELFAGLRETGMLDLSGMDDSYDQMLDLLGAPRWYGLEDSDPLTELEDRHRAVRCT